MRNLKRVIEWTRNGSRNHTAEGAGSENNYAKQPCKDVGAALCFDKRTFLQHNVRKAVYAAGFLYEVYQCAYKQERNERNRISGAFKGVNETIEGAVESCQRRSSAQHHRTRENANKQRDKNIFRH